jgi:hypothetical protein
MADETESQISDVPNLTDVVASEVHEQFRRTEAERVRMVAAAAQGAVPWGAVGGAGESTSHVPENPCGDQDAGQDAQIDALARRDAQIYVL